MLSAGDHALLEAWGRSAYPEEACALLVGSDRPAGGFRLVPCANVAEDRRRRFEVDPSARIRLEIALRGTPERIVGVWHSHPDGEAFPSATDAAMIYEPDLIWLITAIKPEQPAATRAFLPRPGGFDEIPLS